MITHLYNPVAIARLATHRTAGPQREGEAALENRLMHHADLSHASAEDSLDPSSLSVPSWPHNGKVPRDI